MSIGCSLCKSKNTERINAKIRNIHREDIRVYQCSTCGVQFLYPYYSEKELEEFYAEQYRKEYERTDFYLDAELKKTFDSVTPEAERRLNRVKKHLKITDDVLEIGCSSGYFLNQIKPHVNSANGTEWDQNTSNYARKIGFRVEKNHEDYDIKFDKIFMFHVLEHIKEPIDFINNLKSILKKDGMIFIEVPNNNDILISTYDLQEFKDFYYQSAHLWIFNANSLKYLLEKAGFDAVIINLQRYDISNHIFWLKEKRPGGQGFYNKIFSDNLKMEYEKMLIKCGKTDTIFAICKANDLCHSQK